MSIGRSAIFLIGGRTKDIKPVPILVRSGDVVIMSGESRYWFHGVPYILSAEEENILFPSKSIDFISAGSSAVKAENCEAIDPDDQLVNANVDYYLTVGRININVRQVVHLNEPWISKCGSGAMKSH